MPVPDFFSADGLQESDRSEAGSQAGSQAGSWAISLAPEPSSVLSNSLQVSQ